MSDHIPETGKMVSARDVLIRCVDSCLFNGDSGDIADRVLREFAAAGYVVERDWCHDMQKAPRDRRDGEAWGPPLQLYRKGLLPMTGRWFQMPGDKTGWWNVAGKPFYPTAWRHLPAPPAAKETKE